MPLDPFSPTIVKKRNRFLYIYSNTTTSGKTILIYHPPTYSSFGEFFEWRFTLFNHVNLYVKWFTQHWSIICISENWTWGPSTLDRAVIQIFTLFYTKGACSLKGHNGEQYRICPSLLIIPLCLSYPQLLISPETKAWYMNILQNKYIQTVAYVSPVTEYCFSARDLAANGCFISPTE